MRKEKQPTIGYFRGMDVLRFICALGVVFHHATLMLNEKGVSTHAEAIHRFSGAFFLDVFFIISGFLISLILMKEYETGNFSLKNFYIRRIIRIWPLYFLAVFVKIFLFPTLGGIPWDVIKTNLLYAFTFTINFQLLFNQVVNTYTILWSICIEEHIYLILPFLLLLFKKKFRTVSFFLIIAGIISWLYFSGIHSNSNYSTSYFVSTSYFYYFGIGILIACIQNGSLPGRNLEIFLFRSPIQVLVSLIFFGFVFNAWGDHRSLPVILFIHGAFGGYLVWASTRENFIFNLKPKLSRYMGNISYAMYITHIITISLAIAIFKKKGIHFSEAHFGWGLPFLAAIFCIALSTLLYYCFERPILKFKNRFTTVINKQ
ncbi:MAG: acyltransferase family protein [Bacteroidia bacterium]